MGRIVGAQFDLEKAIVEISRQFIGVPAAVNDQLRALSGLQRQIGAASPTDVAALRAVVSQTVAAAHAAIQESRAAVADAIAADSLGLSGNAAAARQQVQATMAAMQRFDPYLRFASPEDEADYRKREDERRAYIDTQLAKGTPQGDLNASAGALGQMVDAKAHGAGDSPEFQQRWDELVATSERLRDAVRRSGQSTAEFDTRLRTELRATLKAKGLSDAQIDAQLTAYPDNPLQAVKAYMQGDDLRALDRSISVAGDHAASPINVVAAEAPAMTMSVDDAMAEFRAAGIATTETQPDAQFAHGLTAKERLAPAAGRTGTA